MAMPPSISITAGGIPVLAMTEYGNITGRYSRADRVSRFLGIPIGATTAGANRFTEPKPPSPWSGVLETIQTASCTQDNGGINPGSEDCLKIDVICPAADSFFAGMPMTPPAGTYPVQVWVYGGGFYIESYPLYQSLGEYYAGSMTTGKVVSAFPKYRLSTLGFLSHPALRNNIAGQTHSGNWGMYDILNGLRWVQNNIGYFGGDSGRVTINGESAGATLSSMIFASPLTYSGAYATKGPLIHGAVLQSLWQVASNGVTYSQPVHDVYGDAVLYVLGCTPSLTTSTLDPVADLAELTALADCLRSKAGSNGEFIDPLTIWSTFMATLNPEVIAGFNTLHGMHSAEILDFQTMGYNPCVDGYALDKAPINLWKEGTNGNAKTHLLVGGNADEMTLYMSGPIPESPLIGWAKNFGFFWAAYSDPAMDNTATLAQITAKSLAIPVGASTPYGEALPNYYSAIVDPFQWQSQALTDAYFHVNHISLLDTLAAQAERPANSLFRYLFAEPNRGDVAAAVGPGGAPLMYGMMPMFGVPHTIELTYTWGYYLQGKNALTDQFGGMAFYTYSDAQMAMGATMKEYWANFFGTGNPSVAGSKAPVWKAQSATDKHVMFFQSTVPSGAMLDPCVMVSACKVEKGYDFRRPEHEFWLSGFETSPPQPACESVDIGFSHIGYFTYGASCLIPHGCAPWCNVYTCSLYACESCITCVDYKAGKTCAGWCNKFTSAFSHCAGC